MATILAHITVVSGRERDFEAIAADLYRESHATETGLLRYEYWRGAAPSTYYSLLAFEDYDAFIRHQVSPHHVAASRSLRGVLADIRLEWLDPLGEASPLPPTIAGSEGATEADEGDDMSELERGYRSRQPVELQDWWLTLG